MCTVTFWPRRGGFRLGMNRDEQWSRPISLPPTLRRAGRFAALCPSESGGGTWIGVNESGATFALVNWYSVTAPPGPVASSRGLAVSQLLATNSPEESEATLREWLRPGIRPFRLIGFFVRTRQVIEWRWNGEHLESLPHSWEPRQWISSGLDEPTANRVRSESFRLAARSASAGSARWFQSLHRSHLPERGAFSHCVHRSDAGTVSYTEISVGTRLATMKHHLGCPCTKSGTTSHTLALREQGGANGKFKMKN